MEINKLQNLENTQKMELKMPSKGEPVDKMQDFLKNFIGRAEFELSDIGFFRPIFSECMNDNPMRYVGKIGLVLSPENTSSMCKNRILEVVVEDESGKYETFKILKEGGRKELLDYLKSAKVLEDLESYITETSDRFFMRDNM